MSYVVKMPALGESVTEGTVTRWLKKEGDKVDVDEPLLEVSTDKVDTEIPSPQAGILGKIVAQEEDTVEVGGELAHLLEEGESADSSSDETSDDSTDSEDTSGDESSDDKASTDTDTEDSSPQDDSSQKASSSDSSSSSDSAQGTTVEMPALGESVTEGTITRWLKEVGDTVEVDEPLVEVSTDKVDTEIPSPVAGTVQSISAQVDDVVPVGTAIAVIGDGSAPSSQSSSSDDSSSEKPSGDDKESTASEDQEESKSKSQESQSSSSSPKSDSQAKDQPQEKKESAETSSHSSPSTKYPSSQGATPYVTPLVRKLAQENNIDLSSIKGTGVGGRIRKQDVLAAAGKGDTDSSASSEQSSSQPAPQKKTAIPGVKPELASLRGTTQKINRVREITAKSTRQSLAESAQLTQVHEINFTKIVALRKQYKEQFQKKHDTSLTFLPFIAKAAVEALLLHPNVNASIDEDKKEITYHKSVNLGIAVDTEQGLLSPVIHNAQDLSLPELSRAIVDIAERARNRKLKPDDVFGGTFTITNIGSNGALTDTPILVPPQAAMLGTGAIVKRAAIVANDQGEDSISIHSMALFPLTYDHRLVDGADAGRFLTTIKARLEDADFLDDLQL